MDGTCSNRIAAIGTAVTTTGRSSYAELKKARKVEHDVQIYRAYEREAARLQERGARIERVALDYELKREWLRRREHAGCV